MPGSCAVVGCKSRFVRGGKHFYRFPKNEQLKHLWIQFTRKGNDFDVKKCSAVCEDHFADDRVVVKKKGRLYLVKKTVPTIYNRETKDGLERVIVQFDPVNFQYIGEESVNLLRGTISAEEEKALIHERRSKVKELKNLCRFCFESQDEKFVAISKLEAYSIDPDEMLLLVGIGGAQYNEVFSEIVCEQCFQQIVSIDGYRKRCRKAQDDLIVEMQELDVKLQNVRSLKLEERPWFKYDPEVDECHQASHIEIIEEEHLDDNISYVGDEDDEKFDAEEYAAQGFIGYKMEIQNEPKEFRQIILKDEPMEDIIEQTDPDFEPDFENVEEDEDEEDEDDDFRSMVEPLDKDVYHVTEIDTIIKNPERNTFALRVYECFFCRLVSSNIKHLADHPPEIFLSF